MNIVTTVKSEEVKTEPGTQLVLDRPDFGWTIKSGKVELFLAAIENGKQTSQRHFLLEARGGDVILPILEPLQGMRVLLITPEASVLVPSRLEGFGAASAGPQGTTQFVEQIDRWINGLSMAVAAVGDIRPDDAQATTPGNSLDAQPGTAVTARQGVAWVESSDAELVYCEGTTLPKAQGIAAIPVAPGTWVSAASAGKLTAVATGDVLKTPRFSQVLREFHKLSFGAIGRAVVEKQSSLEPRIAARVQAGERLTERVVNSFHTVAKKSRRAWERGAHEDERLLAVFMIVAEAVGLDVPQREREKIAKAKTLDEAVRAARLRQRQIALRGDWRREDLGPLIGFLDEERRVVALLPTGTNRWRMMDPVDGSSRMVDPALAARIAPTAHMLYPTLPDRPLTFKDFVSFGSGRNWSDLSLAVGAAIAGAALSLATPLAMRLAFDRFIPGHNQLQLAQLALGLTFAAVISTLFRIAYDRAALRVDGRAGGGLAAAVMDRVLRLPESALRFGPADLALRVGSADQVRRTLYNVLLTLIPAFFLAVVNGGLLFYYAHWAAAVAMLCFLLLCGLSVLFARLQREAQRRGEELASDVFNIVFQLVQAIGVLRTTGSEVRAFAHWGVDFAELRARSYKARKLSTFFEMLLSGIDLLCWAGMFLLISMLPSDAFSTGAFIAFVTAYGAFSGNSMQIVRSAGTLASLDTSWERATPLLRAAPERTAQRRDPGRLSGKIDVTNVAFRYNADAPPALSGVSLQASPGEFIAIVGASGSGKSTMMRLLLGLDQPMQGTIQYDGQDMRHLDPELVRRQIGVVLQNGKLFPGSLYENIMGSVDGTIDDAWEAAKQAGIDEDIRAMPMGMHTMVTEATAAFSGGQIQRIVIARALVGKPRILLFDEATSALDNVTQSIVSESVSRLAVTRVVIAHRLTTVRQADRIFVFDKGRVAQNGRYDDLVKAHGPFADFAKRQLV
jgi:NHLM bacteriocin system ABC transporter ATP-binding protein